MLVHDPVLLTTSGYTVILKTVMAAQSTGPHPEDWTTAYFARPISIRLERGGVSLATRNRFSRTNFCLICMRRQMARLVWLDYLNPRIRYITLKA
jgi:hypothetical protein